MSPGRILDLTKELRGAVNAERKRRKRGVAHFYVQTRKPTARSKPLISIECYQPRRHLERVADLIIDHDAGLDAVVWLVFEFRVARTPRKIFTRYRVGMRATLWEIDKHGRDIKTNR